MGYLEGRGATPRAEGHARNAVGCRHMHSHTMCKGQAGQHIRGTTIDVEQVADGNRGG